LMPLYKEQHISDLKFKIFLRIMQDQINVKLPITKRILVTFIVFFVLPSKAINLLLLKSNPYQTGGSIYESKIQN
ncbi:MAG: hypothetical protein QXO75_06305, partial [Nitrososphaerota archaeon]